ncbi:MAG: Rid family hydrolase [Azospirillaceae bacterium]|nr:Rid family hydrolase [Azospirillaceae bacterium]
MTTSVSKWLPATAGTGEFFIVVTPDTGGSFARQLDDLFAEYQRACAEHTLDAGTAVTATVFLSDSANQEADLRCHPGFIALTRGGAAVTVIQQQPVGRKVGLLVCHVRRAAGSATRTALAVAGTKAGAAGLAVRTDGYRFVYLRNLRADDARDAGAQTERLMGEAQVGIQSNDVALATVIRTWIYVHDLDAHYPAVSAARNRVFARHGITAQTGFPASTGIEGRSSDHADLVLMDAFAVAGLKPGQSRAMTAPRHMNPTVEYGVTFERGRELVFGDRRHLYVSGTASISHEGEILHRGDVVNQTRRAIANVAALLANSGAAPADMRYLLVYLRDAVDADDVAAVLADSPLATVPRIIVHAAVCRPGWLVEMEGVAIDGRGETGFAAF